MSNILPKKCWHVGRPENIQRVTEDEERARLEKELADAKAEEVLRKRRLELLRKEAKNNQSQTSPSHINLFKDEQDFQATLTGSASSRPLQALKYDAGAKQVQHASSAWYAKKSILTDPEKEKKHKLYSSEDPASLFMKPSYFGR